MGVRFSTPIETGPGARPASCTMGTESFPGVMSGRGVTLIPHTPSSAVVKKEYSYTSTPSMGRTTCREPQCLYKGALFLPLCNSTVTGHCRVPLLHCTVWVRSVEELLDNSLLSFGPTTVEFL